MTADPTVPIPKHVLSALPAAPLRGHVADALRSAIVSGKLPPGSRLREAELAEQLGVSRSPVREALRQLEHQGLVRSRPFKDTEVLGISQDEITGVLVPIRVTVECFAFRKAQPLLTEQDYETLADLIDQMRAAADLGDLQRLTDADVRFHELVIERSNQPHCLQIWQSIEPRVRAHFRRDAPSHVGSEDNANMHADLLHALQRGDEAELVAAVRDHVLDSLKPPT